MGLLLTILAEGTKHTLLGDSTGAIVRMLNTDVKKITSGYARPVLVPAPPKDAPRIGKYCPIVRIDLPPDAIVYLEYHTDEVSRITIYSACYRGTWYLRELRNEQGNGSGLYYREG